MCYYHNMDNHTIAITVSAGALGATLAYLGYNNYMNNDDKNNDDKNNDDEYNDDEYNSEDDAAEKQETKTTLTKTLRSDVPTPTNTVVSSKSPTHNNKPVKEASVEAKQEVKKAVKSEWGQFWQGEYETQRSKSSSPQEVTAADYN
jgi:hypothetical protein